MGRTRPFIVPVCVDDTPETDADVPDSFSAVQWTRLHNGDARPAFVERVSRLLEAKRLMHRQSSDRPAAPAVTFPRGCDPTACPESCRAAANACPAADRGSRGHRRRLLYGGQVAVEAVCRRCADLVID